MTSANDINSKRFEKSAFGYKPDEVDDFLRNLSLDMAQLQRDKDEAEKKLAVLADKIREYREDEDALKEALLGAQRQGHQVVEEAQLKANKIISDANEKAEEIVGETKIQLEKERSVLANMQKEVSDFKANLLELYKKHLDLITAMPDCEAPDEAPAAAVEEEEIPEQEPAAASAPAAEEKPLVGGYPFSEPVPAGESRYGELKFGQNH